MESIRRGFLFALQQLPRFDRTDSTLSQVANESEDRPRRIAVCSMLAAAWWSKIRREIFDQDRPLSSGLLQKWGRVDLRALHHLRTGTVLTYLYRFDFTARALQAVFIPR